MKKIIKRLSILIILLGILGCTEEDYNIDNNVEFNITLQGEQIGTNKQQLLSIYDENELNDILIQLNISKSFVHPNFNTNQAAIIINTRETCSNLEITSISDTEETRLITVTQVYIFSGLCDPVDVTMESYSYYDYIIVDFNKTQLPLSMVFKKRDDDDYDY